MMFSYSTARYYCKIVGKYGLSPVIKEILHKKPVKERLLVKGWVRSVRRYKHLCFVDLVDGSCLSKLQVIMQETIERAPGYGCSVEVEGELVESDHGGQEVELLCDKWKLLGPCSEDYPFHNRLKHSSEYIRTFLHLRPKTQTFGSVLRVRNHASIAIHNFFQNHSFNFIHAPIITLNDCEGAGEVFSLKKTETSPKEKSDIGDSASASNTGEIRSPEGILKNQEVLSDEEFFGFPSYLTVSSQLHLEAVACALSRVYTFGPVFRAENSRSRQHASEFYMLEAEIAFCDNLHEIIELVEQVIKDIVLVLSTTCSNEMKFMCKNYELKEDYWNILLAESFLVMTYAEAIEVLRTEYKSSIKWGEDLSAESKNSLIQYSKGVPIVVTMFPSSIKPFYMKVDEKGLAYCFDVLAPFGGEICGGSLREDSFHQLHTKLEKLGLSDSLSWYLDLRRYGSVPHGGFGIGFDRLLQCLLGIPNIRDVIPFPRRRDDCKC